MEDGNGSAVFGGVGVLGIGMGTYQRPVLGLRSPVMMCSCFLLKTNIWEIVNRTKHPKSQSCPMDNKGPDWRLLKRCAFPAAGGSVGIGRVAVCVDCNVWPFGTWTVICEVGNVGCLLIQGVDVGR